MHPVLVISYIFVPMPILLYIVILILNIRRRCSMNMNKKRILFVTAHPDDECMFFGPAILNLNQYCKVYLLCLSSGNLLLYSI